MSVRNVSAACVIALACIGGQASAGAATMVVCAPGYPGSTEQAQPTMDAFADEVARVSGSGPLAAVYHESAEAGVEAMEKDPAAVALVPLSFYLEYADRLALDPRLLAVPKTGPGEVWSLVAGKGRVGGAEDLAGWEVTGRAGFSPRFVRAVALGGLDLPATTTISFTSRALSSLRAAAAGEPVAVLLDGEQGAALPALRFADDLEVVHRSAELPAFVVCRIGDRMDDRTTAALFEALLSLGTKDGGAAVLDQLRIVRFEHIDPEALDRIREARSRVENAGP